MSKNKDEIANFITFQNPKTLISAPLYKQPRGLGLSIALHSFVEGKPSLHYRFPLYWSFLFCPRMWDSAFCKCTYRRLSGSLHKCLLSSKLVQYCFLVIRSSTSFGVYRPISCPASAGFGSDDGHFLIRLSLFID